MTIVLVVLAVAVAARLSWVGYKFVRLPRAAKRHYPAAIRHRLRWRWLAHNLNLSYEDKHRRGRLGLPFGTSVRLVDNSITRVKVRFPRARFRADAYGIRATARTIPGVGRAEVEAQAVHIANAWGCYRVRVHQPAPDRVEIRGIRKDPLDELIPASILPPWDGRHWMLGRDEWGELRTVSLANVSGSVIAGNPGRGKSESAFSLAVQMVPSPSVELYILDGGGGTDWSGFADCAEIYVEDDLAGAEDLLLEVHQRLMTRRRTMYDELGIRNGWKLGPSEDFKFRWLLVDECHWFLDAESARGDRKREAQVQACSGLIKQLLRKGRAGLHHTTLIAQKPTGGGGMPPDIRDLAGLRWSFGLSTMDAAAAILGEGIREYPSASPTLLQHHEGTASVLLRSGHSPYTLVKFPHIGDLADDVAAQYSKARVPAPRASDATPAAADVPVSS